MIIRSHKRYRYHFRIAHQLLQLHRRLPRQVCLIFDIPVATSIKRWEDGFPFSTSSTSTKESSVQVQQRPSQTPLRHTSPSTSPSRKNTKRKQKENLSSTPLSMSSTTTTMPVQQQPFKTPLRHMSPSRKNQKR